MSISTQYAIAEIPPAFRCLGVRLEPLTIGHCLLLERVGSPFLQSDAGTPGRGDLAMASFICSRSWRKALRWIDSVWCRIWMRLFPAFGVLWIRGLAEFMAYVQHFSKEPRVWHKGEGESTPRNASWLQIIKSELMERHHYTEAEALDMPLNKAMMQFFLIAEKDGTCQFVSDDEIRIIEESRARRSGSTG